MKSCNRNSTTAVNAGVTHPQITRQAAEVVLTSRKIEIINGRQLPQNRLAAFSKRLYRRKKYFYGGIALVFCKGSILKNLLWICPFELTCLPFSDPTLTDEKRYKNKKILGQLQPLKKKNDTKKMWQQTKSFNSFTFPSGNSLWDESFPTNHLMKPTIR